MRRVIWATRGRTWGFRFLLDGGLSDPLPAYERAFSGTEGDPTTCRLTDEALALRFPDPLGRCDAAGRVIPHDIVIDRSRAAGIHSVQDGQDLVWPMLANAYARVWDLPQPPSSSDMHRALGHDANPGGPD